MTLHTLPQLHYCTLRKAVRVALLSRSPLNAYWLVRDPYQRLQSCFRDKLRAMPERMDATLTDSVQFQLDLLSLREYGRLDQLTSLSLESLRQRCLDLKFEDFIATLPAFLPHDQHVWPQYLQVEPVRMARWVYQRKTWRRSLSATLADRLLWQLRGLAARLHPASIPRVKLHILKMEDSDDLALLGHAINCDLGERKSNATTHLRVDTRYSRQSLAIVNEIYREDFFRLGYTMHSDPEQFKALAYPA